MTAWIYFALFVFIVGGAGVLLASKLQKQH